MLRRGWGCISPNWTGIYILTADVNSRSNSACAAFIITVVDGVEAGAEAKIMVMGMNSAVAMAMAMAMIPNIRVYT